MHARASRAGQIEVEQHEIDGMYARLDADLGQRIEARKKVLAQPGEGAAGSYARDREVDRLTEKVRQLRAAEHALCFGHIDGAPGGGDLHIGRIGMRTESGDIVLVDWRAEAARPFYAATMASPMGVRRRRHLRLENRRVIDVSDELLDGGAPGPDDVIGDGPLVAALSGARTGRMREAAATLQTEQDDIVRSPHRGVMVVDGGPGTGKTIVALHRAAYVLYAFPAVTGRGVLVFGPNRRFLTYISEVLPSLGENDVLLATLADLVPAEVTRTDPDRVARLKGRAELADAMAAWVGMHRPHGVPMEIRTAHDTVVLEPAAVDAARRSALAGGDGHNQARTRFREFVVDDLVDALEQRTTQEILDFEDELQSTLGIDLDRFAGVTPGHSGAHRSDDGVDIDWERIREELMEDPSIDRMIGRVWPRLDAEEVVRAFCRDREAVVAALPEVSDADLALLAGDGATGWTTADLALIDEARELVDGPPEHVFGHIVVDEAQQLSPMQWRVLMRRCPDRSMTVVGDLAQAGPTTTVRSWSEALGPFVEGRFVHHTLTVNYRTTAEILESTRPLLARIAPEQQLSRSIRHGEPPEVRTVREGAVVAILLDVVERVRREDPEGLIGIVATAERAAALDAEVAGTGATVIGAPDARGLEFDTVVIVDPAGIEGVGDAGVRDRYVAQTRATQRLVVLQVDGGGPVASS